MDSKGQIYDSEKEQVPKEAFAIMKEEELLLQGVPQKDRLSTLINLRFKAWLAYNKLKPDAVVRVRMRQAFEAGFMARGLNETI